MSKEGMSRVHRGVQGVILDPPSRETAFRRLQLGVNHINRYKRKKGVDVDEVFRKDREIAYDFQVNERVSNILFDSFIQHPKLGNLERRWEMNSDHGFPHARRMEKYLKAVHAYEPTFRNNKAYHFFNISQFLSIRFHDLFELEAGKKKHAEGAALTVLGYLLTPDLILELQTDPRDEYDMPKDYSVSDEDWQKQVWGAAIMILHHSYPEGLRVLSHELEYENGIVTKKSFQKLIDCNKIVAGLETLAQARGLQIDDLFTPFAYGPVNEFIQRIKDGQELNTPEFTEYEIEGLLKATDVFAAIDKLDSILPSELSTARTFQTSSERPFYVPVRECLAFAREKDPDLIRARRVVTARMNLTPGEFDIKLQRLEQGVSDTRFEYELRLVFANSHSSPDDFSRLLFEVQREEFERLGGWIPSMFRHGLLQKRSFLFALLDAIQNNTAVDLIGKEYRKMEDATSPEDLLTLERLETERIIVESIVQAKMEMLQDYIKENPELVNHLRILLCYTPTNFSGNPYLPFELPYDFYFPKYKPAQQAATEED